MEVGSEGWEQTREMARRGSGRTWRRTCVALLPWQVLVLRRKDKVGRREECARGARIGNKSRSSNESRKRGQGWIKWLAEG